MTRGDEQTNEPDDGASTDAFAASAIGPPIGLTVDEALALVLPDLGDLPGRGWTREDDADDDGPGGGLAGLADTCLPDGFPEDRHRADAEVGFRRANEVLVLGLASLFTDRAAATAAWHELAGEPFVRCFAEAIAGDVTAGSSVELLGPLVRPGALTVGRDARRTERWRVSFSGVHDGGLAPVVLHVAVLLAGCVIELLWAVDGGGRAEVDAWEHLVGRAELRADVVVRTHPDHLDR